MKDPEEIVIVGEIRSMRDNLIPTGVEEKGVDENVVFVEEHFKGPLSIGSQISFKRATGWVLSGETGGILKSQNFPAIKRKSSLEKELTNRRRLLLPLQMRKNSQGGRSLLAVGRLITEKGTYFVNRDVRFVLNTENKLRAPRMIKK